MACVQMELGKVENGIISSNAWQVQVMTYKIKLLGSLRYDLFILIKRFFQVSNKEKAAVVTNVTHLASREPIFSILEEEKYLESDLWVTFLEELIGWTAGWAVPGNESFLQDLHDHQVYIILCCSLDSTRPNSSSVLLI